jgi:hypothetical protein
MIDDKAALAGKPDGMRIGGAPGGIREEKVFPT